MPPLGELKKSKFVKMIYIGDSGSGKTGSLVSLVKAGYKLRILDMDAGVGVLASYVNEECPEKIGNVDFETRRDKYKPTPMGMKIEGKAKAWTEAMQLLDKWSDGSNPAEWGADTILVIDSLTRLSQAAAAFSDRLNPTAGDKRQIYHHAQQMIENFLSNITDDAFGTNVILTSHIAYNENETKGFPSSIGKAIGPKIPTYFNNLFQAERVGMGDKARRVIRTYPTSKVDLKAENPFKLDKEVPLSSGMATLFEKLKG